MTACPRCARLEKGLLETLAALHGADLTIRIARENADAALASPSPGPAPAATCDCGCGMPADAAEGLDRTPRCGAPIRWYDDDGKGECTKCRAPYVRLSKSQGAGMRCLMPPAPSMAKPPTGVVFCACGHLNSAHGYNECRSLGCKPDTGLPCEFPGAPSASPSPDPAPSTREEGPRVFSYTAANGDPSMAAVSAARLAKLEAVAERARQFRQAMDMRNVTVDFGAAATAAAYRDLMWAVFALDAGEGREG